MKPWRILGLYFVFSACRFAVIQKVVYIVLCKQKRYTCKVVNKMRKITDEWLFIVDNDGYQVMVVTNDAIRDFGHVITDSLNSSLRGVVQKVEHYYLGYYRATLHHAQIVELNGDYSIVGHVHLEERF